MSEINMIKNEFLDTRSLIAITRANPGGIPASFTVELGNGTKVSLWDTGILAVEPAQHGAIDMVISSGIHGNETAPIEIVDNMVSEIMSGQLDVKNRTLFIIGNPMAMNASERFIVENMNRLFCGKHARISNYEAQRAGQLENHVRRFFESVTGQRERLHYDLHTAIRGSKYPKFAIYPFPDGRPWDLGQLQFFQASDVNTILLSHKPASTFSYFSSHEFSAHAFTVELGKVKPFGENDMSEFSAISRNLKCLVSGQPISLKAFDNNDFNFFQVKADVTRKSDTEFQLNIAGNVENFTEFPAGYQISQDSDGGYMTETDGEAIVFPNAKVPVGQRAGLMVKKTRI